MSPSVISCQPSSSHPPPPQSPASLPPARTNIISENTARCWPRALHLCEPVSRGSAHILYFGSLSLSSFFFTSIQILKYPSRAIQSYVLCCICCAAERFYNVYFYLLYSRPAQMRSPPVGTMRLYYFCKYTTDDGQLRCSAASGYWYAIYYHLLRGDKCIRALFFLTHPSRGRAGVSSFSSHVL
jgi:hypothetical protein